MRELGDDVTDRHTDTRTQPFIVKDGHHDYHGHHDHHQDEDFDDFPILNYPFLRSTAVYKNLLSALFWFW